MKFATVNYAADIARSFGASKNVAGWGLAVCSMVSRPCSCQTSAKSFRKPCENAVRLPTGRPFGLPETPGGPYPAVHRGRRGCLIFALPCARLRPIRAHGGGGRDCAKQKTTSLPRPDGMNRLQSQKVWN